jgi:hypothetical protein
MGSMFLPEVKYANKLSFINLFFEISPLSTCPKNKFCVTVYCGIFFTKFVGEN